MVCPLDLQGHQSVGDWVPSACLVRQPVIRQAHLGHAAHHLEDQPASSALKACQSAGLLGRWEPLMCHFEGQQEHAEHWAHHFGDRQEQQGQRVRRSADLQGC